jgi:hypothetical protein
VIRRLALLSIAAALLAPNVACATTLFNDPTHPFSAADFGMMQGWINHAHISTPRGAQMMTNASCPQPIALACSYDGQTWMPAGNISREVFLHELGRVVNPRLSAAAQAALDVQFHVARWSAGYGVAGYEAAAFNTQAGENISADAYAECAIRSHWSRWWRDRSHSTIIRVRAGRVDAVGGTTGGQITPYPFRPGPVRFARVCAIYRDAIG